MITFSKPIAQDYTPTVRIDIVVNETSEWKRRPVRLKILLRDFSIFLVSVFYVGLRGVVLERFIYEYYFINIIQNQILLSYDIIVY